MAASRKMFLSPPALSGALGHLGRSEGCDRACSWLWPRSSLIRGLFRRPGPAAAQLRGGRPARSVGLLHLSCHSVVAELCLCLSCAWASTVVGFSKSYFLPWLVSFVVHPILGASEIR